MKRGYGKGKYGWVYVYDTKFRNGDKGTYKIGRSVNAKLRESELRAGNPYGKVIFAGFVGGQAKTIEAEFHQRYFDYWIEREMFLLTKEDVAYIKTRLKYIATKWFQL